MPVQNINNITGNFYSDEWFTDAETVKIITDLLQPKGTIICPFDSERSEFVKAASLLGSDVKYGMRDFIEGNYEYDYLMTNPPFSIKDDVIQKVYEVGRPAALVLPLDALGGVRRHEMYQKYGHPGVYIPKRRINYYNKDGVRQVGASFHSVFMFFNSGVNTFIWEGK